jgi:hypothetical protein
MDEVSSVTWDSRSPLGRILIVQRIEAFISVKCETHDMKSEITVKTCRKFLKSVTIISLPFPFSRGST